MAAGTCGVAAYPFSLVVEVERIVGLGRRARQVSAGSTVSVSSWTDFHASSTGMPPTSGCNTIGP